jgi:5-methylcytosine-specific restriction protein A
MVRTVKPWSGRTDDTKAPPRVRQRIFDAAGGVCHICKLPIKTGETWQADHVKALINGGGNTEGNLAPAHGHCHVGKTALDLKEKAKIAKVRGKHIGAIRPAGKMRGPAFAKPDKPQREGKTPLAPRNLFREGPRS